MTEPSIPSPGSRRRAPNRWSPGSAGERRSPGGVEPTGRRKTVFGLESDEYQVLLWEEHDGERRNYRESTVWATTDVPSDVSGFEELLDCMRQVYHRDEKGREELSKIRGIQLRFRLDHDHGRFVTNRYTSETVEISRGVPPEGSYSLPRTARGSTGSPETTSEGAPRRAPGSTMTQPPVAARCD